YTVRAITPPPTGWPSPPGERDPLCEATRGGEVDIAGTVSRLHESICVTLQESDRVRLQVAYGRTYVDLDPATGDWKGGQPYVPEQELFPYIESFTTLRFPRIVPGVNYPPPMPPLDWSKARLPPELCATLAAFPGSPLAAGCAD